MHPIDSIPLFESPRSLDAIDLPDADIRFMHRFFEPAQTRHYFKVLNKETRWNQPMVHVWGKDHVQPRLSCWHGDPDAVYRFSGMTFLPHPWTDTLLDIRRAIEDATRFEFNSVLLNLYRDEHDSIAMHSDDESGLGPAPVIASLSFGATRLFSFRHKQNAAPAVSLALTDGSLLLMAGRTQQCWQHGIRKERRAVGPRINLTFRRILGL